jgi:hypothetical protein
MDFLQFGFNGLLALPRHRTKAGMEVRLLQDENEIALAHRWAVETIRAIESDVQFFGVALEFVTSQTVDLQPLRIIQPFLPGKDDKPMIARETRRTAFPNLPLLNVHRSGFCLTLPIADSSATRSLSGP